MMNKKIAVLNGLRGIAILAVIYRHLYGDKLILSDWHTQLFILPYVVLSNSFQAVALFFVLSAFVLYLPYVRGERTMHTTKDVLDFYKRRAKRLLPLYFISVLFSMIYLHPAQNLSAFVQDILLLTTATFTFHPSTFVASNNFVLWTLSLEIWFSVLLPFLILLIRRIGIGNVIGLMVFCALLTRLVGVLLILSHAAAPLNTSITPVMDTLFGRLDDFATGLLLAYLYVHRRVLLQNVGSIFIGFSLMLLAFILHSFSKASIVPIMLLAFSNTLLDISFLMLIAYALTRHTAVTKLLTVWPLQMAGLMSYSLYIWHGLAIYTLFPLRNAFHLFQYFFLIIIFSWFSYRYIEHGSVTDYRKLLPTNKANQEPTL